MDNQTDTQDRQSEEPTEAVKKRATTLLGQIVDQIDEPAERKFELLMMAIRASRQPGLLQQALGAAEQIENATAKAEALIDVINEATFLEKEFSE